MPDRGGGATAEGVMHLLFDIFVLPPAVIAGVVFIATWNLRDAVIGFRVAFFAWGLENAGVVKQVSARPD
jgi:hypothetical protein